jgi:hypothetical protein
MGYRQASTNFHVGSLTIVTQAIAADSPGPEVSQETASTNALKKASEARPDVNGMHVSVAARKNGLQEVKDSNGHVIFSNSAGINAWILELTAPSQLGFKYVSGAAIVEVGTGKVRSLSILLSNS